jgi:hypothetical protein
MFPFKFEFEEAIFNYYSTSLDANNSTGSRSIVPMFAIYYMYLHGDMIDEVRNLAVKHDLKHYLIDSPQGAIEYIKSLPDTHYNMHMFDKEEYEILNFIGFSVHNANEYSDVHKHILEYVAKHYPKYNVRFFLSRLFYLSGLMILTHLNISAL